MKQKICLIVLILCLSAIPKVYAGECAKFIELRSALDLAKEFGAPGLIPFIKVDLWELPEAEGKGDRVGRMLPDTSVIVIEQYKNDFKVESPLDRTIGWVNKDRVHKVYYQDVDTFESCKPLSLKKVKKLCARTKGELLDCSVAFAEGCENPMYIEGKTMICSCPEGKDWFEKRGCR